MTFLVCFYMGASGLKKLIMLLHDEIFFLDPAPTIFFLKKCDFLEKNWVFSKIFIFRKFSFFFEKTHNFDKNKNIKIL